MEKNLRYELFLNRMTLWEQLESPATFEEYKKHVILLLQCKDLYISEDDILKQTRAKDIEQALTEHPHILYTGRSIKNKAGEKIKVYCDLGAEYSVSPQDLLYDTFFAYKLRQVDILQTDQFLGYQLARYYNSNAEEFSRFLQLCIRKHQDKLLSPLIVQTVNEWIAAKEKQSQAELSSGAEERTGRKKGSRLKREAHDKLTSLSQEQTVLLMYYLQQERVILRDEFLSDLDAGRAFEILTGYSQHTLRQAFSKFSLYLTKENLREIDHLLTRMKIAIDKDLKGK
jgi:hypothetical protein